MAMSCAAASYQVKGEVAHDDVDVRGSGRKADERDGDKGEHRAGHHLQRSRASAIRAAPYDLNHY